MPIDRDLRGDAHRRHDDRERRAGREPNQLDVFEGMRIARRRDREGQIVREAREQARRLIDDIVHLAAGLAKLIANAPDIVRSERFALHQPVDVGAVAGVRGDPARRGMRLDQVAARFELGHFVANGR